MRDTITIRDGEKDYIEITYTKFLELVKTKLKETLINIIGEHRTNKYIEGKTPLCKLGVCNGITLLIDKELITIHKDLCILDTETYSKFLKDLRRDFFK